MKRRAFLKTAAAVFPAAVLEDYVLGQDSIPASHDPIHAVGAGQDRFDETHSLGFSTILFKTATRETNGSLFVIEHKNLRKGGPPMHIHLHQEEFWYVLEGEVLFQLGDKRQKLGPGDSIVGPRGVPHGFTLVSEKPGRMVIAFTPAGKMEQFFRDIAVPGGPKLEAAVFAKYEMEMVGPPVVA